MLFIWVSRVFRFPVWCCCENGAHGRNKAMARMSWTVGAHGSHIALTLPSSVPAMAATAPVTSKTTASASMATFEPPVVMSSAASSSSASASAPPVAVSSSSYSSASTTSMAVSSSSSSSGSSSVSTAYAVRPEILLLQKEIRAPHVVVISGIKGHGKRTVADFLSRNGWIDWQRMSLFDVIREVASRLTDGCIPSSRMISAADRARVIVIRDVLWSNRAEALDRIRSAFAWHPRHKIMSESLWANALDRFYGQPVPHGANLADPAFIQSLTLDLFLQKIDTSLGRDSMHPDIWVDAWFLEWTARGKPSCLLVDTLFPNEVERMRHHEVGAWTVVVDASVRLRDTIRECVALDPRSHAHALADLGLPWDLRIRNDGTVDELHTELLRHASLFQLKGAFSTTSVSTAPSSTPTPRRGASVFLVGVEVASSSAVTRATAKLLTAGFAVAHADHFRGDRREMYKSDAMELRALSRCDVVYLMDGWHHSKKAVLQAQVAESLGLTRVTETGHTFYVPYVRFERIAGHPQTKGGATYMSSDPHASGIGEIHVDASHRGTRHEEPTITLWFSHTFAIESFLREAGLRASVHPYSTAGHRLDIKTWRAMTLDRCRVVWAHLCRTFFFESSEESTITHLLAGWDAAEAPAATTRAADPTMVAGRHDATSGGGMSAERPSLSSAPGAGSRDTRRGSGSDTDWKGFTDECDKLPLRDRSAMMRLLPIATDCKLGRLRHDFFSVRGSSQGQTKSHRDDRVCVINRAWSAKEAIGLAKTLKEAKTGLDLCAKVFVCSCDSPSHHHNKHVSTGHGRVKGAYRSYGCGHPHASETPASQRCAVSISFPSRVSPECVR
jgi:hypothetical protein